MIYDAEFLKAVDEIRSTPLTLAEAPSTQNVCSVYTKIKPILQGIVPFLSLIPKIGAQAAAALKALMTGLDSLCSSSAPISSVKSVLSLSAVDTAFVKFDALASLLPESRTDICTIYRDVRPILEAILPFLRLIPSIGDAIALAITALIAALDGICPRK